MRLTHNDPFGISGISDRKGLLCRGGCRASFVPTHGDDAHALRVAAAERDAHELGVHGYQHVHQPTSAWAFHARFTSRGRSSLRPKVPVPE